MSNPAGPVFRTLSGYGINGVQFIYPNGSVISMKMNIDGKPEVTVEGDAVIHRIKNDHVTIIE